MPWSRLNHFVSAKVCEHLVGEAHSLFGPLSRQGAVDGVGEKPGELLRGLGIFDRRCLGNEVELGQRLLEGGRQH